MLVAQAKPINYERAKEMAKSKVPDRPVVLLGKFGVRKLWDNYELITEVQIDDRHLIRIAAATINGYRYIVMREFYWHSSDTVWKPGRNGLRIPMKNPFFTKDRTLPEIKDIGDDFLEGVIKAVETAKTMDLANQENTQYILRNYMKSTIIKAKETSSNENQQP